MSYEPTAQDIAWAVNVLLYLCEGGILGYPDSALIFKISHKTKSLTLINPDVLWSSEQSHEVYKRTVEVFKKIGYTVTIH